MTCYYLIPVYNEAPNLPLLYSNLVQSLPGEKKYYVFVDDHSEDETISILEKLLINEPHYIITKLTNLGPGDSFNQGFNWILSHSSNENDIVITMEADNTSDIHLLYDMFTISNLGYDLVLASVYAQGGGFDRTTFFRKVISFIANMVFRSFFNIKVLTLSSFYRIYHIELLQKIKTTHTQIIKEKGFLCMLEILIKAIRQDAKIIEIPMLLKSYQRKGKSKMKIISNTFQYIRFLFSTNLLR